MSTDKADGWINTREAVEILGCSHHHIHRLAEANKIRSRKIPKPVRIVLEVNESDIRNYKYDGRGRRFGAKNKTPKGRNPTKNRGYTMIHVPSHPKANYHGYVGEHTLTMEKTLGRYLEGKEEVHHINGIRHDNRPENLELMKSRSDHLKRGHSQLRGIMDRMAYMQNAIPDFVPRLNQFLDEIQGKNLSNLSKKTGDVL